MVGGAEGLGFVQDGYGEIPEQSSPVDPEIALHRQFERWRQALDIGEESLCEAAENAIETLLIAHPKLRSPDEQTKPVS
jgi:hypothetical protein